MAMTQAYTPFAYVELAHPGVNAIFRALPMASTVQSMKQLERRDRIVFMLLDGKRTIHHVARLTHHTEIDVARIVVRLLKSGYIEYIWG